MKRMNLQQRSEAAQNVEVDVQMRTFSGTKEAVDSDHFQEQH